MQPTSSSQNHNPKRSTPRVDPSATAPHHITTSKHNPATPFVLHIRARHGRPPTKNSHHTRCTKSSQNQKPHCATRGNHNRNPDTPLHHPSLLGRGSNAGFTALDMDDFDSPGGVTGGRDEEVGGGQCKFLCFAWGLMGVVVVVCDV
jgi:hypothetical protein